MIQICTVYATCYGEINCNKKNAPIFLGCYGHEWVNGLRIAVGSVGARGLSGNNRVKLHMTP